MEDFKAVLERINKYIQQLKAVNTLEYYNMNFLASPKCVSNLQREYLDWIENDIAYLRNLSMSNKNR